MVRRVFGRFHDRIVVKLGIDIDVVKVADLIGQVSIHYYWAVKSLQVLMDTSSADQALDLKRVPIDQEVEAFLIRQFWKGHIIPGGYEVLCNDSFSDVALKVTDRSVQCDPSILHDVRQSAQR